MRTGFSLCTVFQSFGNVPSDLLFAGEGQTVMMDTGVFQKIALLVGKVKGSESPEMTVVQPSSAVSSWSTLVWMINGHLSSGCAESCWTEQEGLN